MLDNIFCEYLENEICKAIQIYPTNETKDFWCGGVLLSEPFNTYTTDYIIENKQVLLKAYVGKNGQEEYDLILKFGELALSYQAKNMDIINCLPNIELTNWLSIDTNKKTIVIHLI